MSTDLNAPVAIALLVIAVNVIGGNRLGVQTRPPFAPVDSTATATVA